MNEVRLIPYEVETVVKEISEVPKGVQLVRAASLWDEAEQGKGRVIAVLDTGVQKDHPDLKDRIIGGRNFTNDYGGDPALFVDNNGHGTHVCGTIAASANQRGVVGVAPLAKLLVLKVLTGEGSGRYEWIIEGIRYASQWRGEKGEKVNVISMSLGGPENIPEMHEAIKEAVAQGISVVVAAGNRGDDRSETIERSYPGLYNEVIQVGAVNNKKKPAPFTNSNEEIDLVAPGVHVLSTYIGSRYARLSGTSMATPHVAGALALLMNWSEKHFSRKLNEAEIYAQLIRRTLPLEESPALTGNGFLSLDLVKRIRQTDVLWEK